MIEFTLNRNKNGKKSRWSKKYPRKRILKRGSEKAAGWYFHNWLDDDYHHFRGDLHKFLLKNVGRPVDKVFSEFLQSCMIYVRELRRQIRSNFLVHSTSQLVYIRQERLQYM